VAAVGRTTATPSGWTTTGSTNRSSSKGFKTTRDHSMRRRGCVNSLHFWPRFRKGSIPQGVLKLCRRRAPDPPVCCVRTMYARSCSGFLHPDPPTFTGHCRSIPQPPIFSPSHVFSVATVHPQPPMFSPWQPCRPNLRRRTPCLTSAGRQSCNKARRAGRKVQEVGRRCRRQSLERGRTTSSTAGDPRRNAVCLIHSSVCLATPSA
jgi:hypothetical protein